MRVIILIFFALFHCSCMLAHYEITNELTSDKSHTHSRDCNINYFLLFTSNYYSDTFGPFQGSYDKTLVLLKKHEESIENVLKQKGCKITQAENKNTANFIIRVRRQIAVSTLPQSWLTTLSLGLIPSWGTRLEQFVYTFEDKKTETEHSYIIDMKIYHHLVLIPVFWVNFYTLDELNVFEETFNNFLENS